MAEEKKVEAAPEQSSPAKRQRTSPKQRRQQSAMRYITILFAAAFVLMLFTYLMERRQKVSPVDSADIQRYVVNYHAIDHDKSHDGGKDDILQFGFGHKKSS